MDFSSPLAAMRPQACHPWANRKDLPASRLWYSGCHTYAPPSFDFTTMSMHSPLPPRLDYFNAAPMRGSSPTADLTADLGANFHIDKSPVAPTPRRSLFTADILGAKEESGRLNTPPIEVETATTPPILSSSPYFEAMDISPLPHKVPHFVAQVTLPSPLIESPDEVALIQPPLPSPDTLQVPEPAPIQPPIYLQLPERRRPASRPALSRTKGFSTSSIPQRPESAKNQLPPFRFGNVATSGLSCSSTPSALDAFSESPLEELASPSFGSMLPLPRRTSVSSANRTNGSPLAGHVRKPSGGRPAFVRPQRKLVRRSLSMFQHPDDVMKEENEAFEQRQPSLVEAVPEPSLKLPHFTPGDEPDSLPRITHETMLDILSEKYNSTYSRILVIDCRFEYEYKGGHIENAVNFNDKQTLANELFTSNASTDNTLLIFHCEYSVHRAPLTAKFIRSHDRNVNIASYPHLTYPEMYILDGGYSRFFAEVPSKCFPQSYVEMNDQRHELACERGMAKVKQQRQKLFRHQTFAFGQNDHDAMDDSPTAPQMRAPLAMGPRSRSAFDVGDNVADGMGPSFQRRLASY